MRTLRGPVVSLLLLAALTAAPPALAGEVDDLFTQGTAALEAGKHEDALRFFLAAWKLRKTHDVAANLAQAELQLGKHRDAAEHLAFALRTFPVSGKAAVRTQIEDMLAAEKKQVVTLVVRVDVDKAEVSVQGRPAGTTPIAEELFADVGTVTVEAGAAGYQPARQTFEARKGDARAIELKMVRKEVPKERSMLGPAIAFGAGGAGLVVGVIAGAITGAQMESVKKTCGPQLDCPESFRGQVDDARITSRVATVGFVLAGVGAAVGVTLLLIPTKRATPSGTALVVGPTYVGVKGAF